MKQSKLFTKTQKSSKEFDSKNATLLTKGGFIEQQFAGVYNYLTLGLIVLNKIENIVRQEMSLIANEIFMPTLASIDMWEKTGRFDTVDVLFKAYGANEISKKKSTNEYVVQGTHEETVTPLVQKFVQSYKDLPVAVFQIQTKFRNEARAKSGILRGREFRMKDLYSFHSTIEDLNAYYEIAKQSYVRIYEKMGFNLNQDLFIVNASGGDFSSDFSHEFQIKTEIGEDEIYLDRTTGICYNKEVIVEENIENKYEIFNASEVGNIFKLGTKFSRAFDFKFKNDLGEDNLVVMGCYGIGTSKLMGVIVEKFHDDKGIIWPESISPFQVHLLCLNPEIAEVKKFSENIYQLLQKFNIEVLLDDREEVSNGARFADADLIGIPYRVVISKRTLENGGELVEVKKRSEKESELINIQALIELIKNK